MFLIPGQIKQVGIYFFEQIMKSAKTKTESRVLLNMKELSKNILL